MTHPSDTAGAVERMKAALHSAEIKHTAVALVAPKDLRSILSLNATLQGRVDLAVGALERLCGLEYPSREEHDRAWDYAQETLSKLKERAGG